MSKPPHSQRGGARGSQRSRSVVRQSEKPPRLYWEYLLCGPLPLSVPTVSGQEIFNWFRCVAAKWKRSLIAGETVLVSSLLIAAMECRNDPGLCGLFLLLAFLLSILFLYASQIPASKLKALLIADVIGFAVAGLFAYSHGETLRAAAEKNERDSRYIANIGAPGASGDIDQSRIEGLVAAAKSAVCQHTDKLEPSEREDAEKVCIGAIQALVSIDAPTPKIEDALNELSHGNRRGATTLFEQVYEKSAAEGAQDNTRAADAAAHLGALAFNDDTQTALEWYRKAVALDATNWESWKLLGYLLERTGQLHDAEDAYNRVVSIGQSRGDPGVVATGHLNLGQLSIIRADYGQAESMFKSVLQVYQTIGDTEGVANAYIGLGRTYHELGKFAQAKAMFEQALALYQMLNRLDMVAGEYDNLAAVDQLMMDWTDAEEMDQRALDLFRKLGDKGGMAHVYGNLGHLYLVGKHDPQRAETMQNMALTIDLALDRKEDLAVDYENLGLVFMATGRPASAEQMFKKKFDIDQTLGRKPGSAAASFQLGAAYAAQGKWRQARSTFKQAIEIYDEIGSKDLSARVQAQLDQLPAASQNQSE
jgi:tetratricopeptide (TPR) repeat protein